MNRPVTGFMLTKVCALVGSSLFEAIGSFAASTVTGKSLFCFIWGTGNWVAHSIAGKALGCAWCREDGALVLAVRRFVSSTAKHSPLPQRTSNAFIRLVACLL